MWTRITTWINTQRSANALTRAEALQGAENLETARQEYERAIKLAPPAGANAGAREILGRAHLGLGRVFLAGKSTERALRELQHACRIRPEAWEPFYWKGCALGWKGDYKGAERDFTHALKLRPSEGRIHIQRAYARLKGGKPDDALADLVSADERGALSRNPVGLITLARLRMQRGEWREAERVLRHVLKDQPKHPGAALLLGRALESQEKWADAVALYRMARHLEGAEPEACERLGAIHERIGDDGEARTWFQQAMAQGQIGDDVLFQHGRVCFRLRSYAECVRYWTILNDRRPGDNQLTSLLSRAKYAWASDLVRQGRLDEGIPLLEECFTARPADSRFARSLAALHLRLAGLKMRGDVRRDREKARRHLKRARELRPADTQVLLHSARIEWQVGDRRAAMRAFRDAIVLAPDDPSIQFYLALCLLEDGDVVGAEQELQTARRASGGAPWADRAGRALVALYVRQCRWAEAARVLMDGTLSEKATGLLAECLFRAKHLKQLEALTSPVTEVYLWQAAGLASEGRLLEAVTALRKLSQAQPDFPAGRMVLARFLHQMALEHAGRDEWEEAAGALTDAMRAEEGSCLGRMGLAESMILLLAGHRHQAVRILAATLRERRDEARVAHALGLAAFFTVCGARNSERSGEDPDLWDRVISAWVMVWHNADFRETWRARASERYGAELSSEDVGGACQQLEEHVARLAVEAEGGRRPGADVLLERERRAAELLGRLGGFPVSERGGAALVCGPLMLQLLGLDREFGRFVVQRQHAAHPENPMARLLQVLLGMAEEAGLEAQVNGAETNRLVRYFSQLGTAQALLELDRGEEALAALGTAACPWCRAVVRPSRTSRQWLPTVCEDTCPDFQMLNPAYADGEAPGRRLRDDAVALAIEVRLRLAELSLTAREGTLQSTIGHWQEGLRLAQILGRKETIESRILEATLARAQALARTKRLDQAIALIQMAEGLCGDGARQTLLGRRAELLLWRGVAAGNENPPRWGAAVTDLRAAVTCNPHAPSSLINLGVALQNWAGEQFEAGRSLDAVRLHVEAVQQLDAGSRRIPGHDQLVEQRTRARETLEAAAKAGAANLASLRRFDDALAVLREGLSVLDSESMRAMRRHIFNTYGVSLANEGSVGQAVAVLQSGLAEFPGDRTMLENLATARLMMMLLRRPR
jgi:tetratricopeptide (TPR) repeat protein